MVEVKKFGKVSTGGAKPAAEKPAKPEKAAKPVKEAKPKIERLRQNGQTRPLPGTKTGLVWDIADAISSKMKRPALRAEVFTELEKQAKNPSFAMAGTQYSRWGAFHDVTAELKKFKAAENTEKDAAAAQEKAEKKAKAEADKKAKEVAADKAKADKAAEKAKDEKAKAEKQSAKKAA